MGRARGGVDLRTEVYRYNNTPDTHTLRVCHMVQVIFYVSTMSIYNTPPPKKRDTIVYASSLIIHLAVTLLHCMWLSICANKDLYYFEVD